MNTDKNTVIGFVLLAGLFFMYFWYTNKQQTDLATYKKHFDDSVAMMKAIAEKDAALQNPIKLDSTTGSLVNNIDTVKETFTYLENELVKVKFSNKGGQVAEVTLKKYTNYKKELVKLGDSSSLNYPINIGDNKTLQVNHILFPTKTITAGENGAQKIEYAYTTPVSYTHLTLPTKRIV